MKIKPIILILVAAALTGCGSNPPKLKEVTSQEEIPINDAEEIEAIKAKFNAEHNL